MRDESVLAPDWSITVPSRAHAGAARRTGNDVKVHPRWRGGERAGRRERAAGWQATVLLAVSPPVQDNPLDRAPRGPALPEKLSATPTFKVRSPARPEPAANVSVSPRDRSVASSPRARFRRVAAFRSRSAQLSHVSLWFFPSPLADSRGFGRCVFSFSGRWWDTGE